MAETPSGMLNSIGLQGPGVDAFVEKDLAWLRQRGARAVVSIAGSSVDEYVRLATRLRAVDGISAIEVNISCPNVEDRGQVFACDPVAAAAVVHGRAPRDAVGRARPREAVAGRHRHRRGRPVGGRRRRRRSVADQHPARAW